MAMETGRNVFVLDHGECVYRCFSTAGTRGTSKVAQTFTGMALSAIFVSVAVQELRTTCDVT